MFYILKQPTQLKVVNKAISDAHAKIIRSENPFLNSEKWATNLLIIDHFSLGENLTPKAIFTAI